MNILVSTAVKSGQVCVCVESKEKQQYRSVIRFLFLEGNMCEKIKEKLRAVYKDHAPTMAIIRYWFNEYKCGRTSIID